MVDNYYQDVAAVGEWGGLCTCPSGEVYNVGDLRDGCAHGPQSLACEGGTPGECEKQVDPARNGMRVVCGSLPVPTPSPTPQPQPELIDDYRKADPPERVGAWGGWCTCPSGRRYNVGDKWDSCVNGPLSLACEGGTPAECIKTIDPERDGMKVTCGDPHR